MANFITSQAVARFSQELNIPMDFSSLKVWTSFAGRPSEVGTGTTPQSRLSL